MVYYVWRITFLLVPLYLLPVVYGGLNFTSPGRLKDYRILRCVPRNEVVVNNFTFVYDGVLKYVGEDFCDKNISSQRYGNSIVLKKHIEEKCPGPGLTLIDRALRSWELANAAKVMMYLDVYDKSNEVKRVAVSSLYSTNLVLPNPGDLPYVLCEYIESGDSEFVKPGYTKHLLFPNGSKSDEEIRISVRMDPNPWKPYFDHFLYHFYVYIMSIVCLLTSFYAGAGAFIQYKAKKKYTGDSVEH